jgi:uncharacterized repeat protein (TIGR01451 family)
MKFSRHVRHALSWCAIALALFAIERAWAHSVGQVQTTKFMAPETVSMLLARAGTSSPGLAVGDSLSYIIQFSPISNGADVGVAGYITDYIPPGTEVVGAAIVAKDGAGNYYNVAPNFPGGIDLGWGSKTANIFLAPFSSAAYDATGRCAAAGFTDNCNARLTELHADTGIFFSTDPRTAVFPALPTRIQQGVNGYDISPTGEGQLNPIIGQARATTHNLWDADQTNAFGSTPAAIGTLVAPLSTITSLNVTGRGATPYNAGSGVAGPQTGYPLDNTAKVGPWQRIAYAGSRIGDNTNGPATSTGASLTGIGGFPTSVGYNLSVSNPLPGGTNAVRWAVGKLVVGQTSYVKITLRLTAPVPTAGIMNSSEVFGGDAGDADDGKDNIWRYHIPSVADNNSNLLVQKTVKCVYDAGGVCQPSNGAYIPAGSRVRYQIVYLNSGALAQTDVVLQDFLPCQTAANASTVTTIVSGSITFPAVNPPVTPAGNCGTFARGTVTFPTLSTLAPGAGGAIEIDVKNTGVTGDVVVNTAKLSSAEVPGGVTSSAVSNVASAPSLAITKVANAATAPPGGTVSYSIVVENVGSANATGITLYDVLPSLGGAVNANTRFSYSSTGVVTLAASPAGSVLVLPPVVATSVPPTLVPYSSSPVASNSQQISWTFGASTLVPGGKFTLTYTVNVGVSVSASVTPYYNNAIVTYAGGGAGRADAPSTAGVLVTSPLSVAKTIDCYFIGTSCVAINGSAQIPANAKMRYRLDYANTGASSISNVVLNDTLPCQTPANSVSNIQIIGGPIPVPSPNPPVTAAGVCPGTRITYSFPATTLAAGQTGTIKVDVQTNAAEGAIVVNTAGLSATGFPSATSDAQAVVVAQPVLQITKTAGASKVAPGTTVSYTITVSNVGTTAAQSITVYDWLPTSSPTNSVTTRFSYVNTSAIVGMTAVTPVVNRPPTQAPYNSATTNPNLNNQEEVAWSFGAQTLTPGASFSISFNALAGSAMPLSPPTYDNYARASFSGGAVNSGVASASVALLANLSITKSNGTTTLTAGSATRYTVTVSNLGPSAAGGSVVKDVAGAGLLCTAVTCASTAGGATCPAALSPTGTSINAGSTAFFSTGEAIPSFPANSSVVFAVDCGVIATGQ